MVLFCIFTSPPVASLACLNTAVGLGWAGLLSTDSHCLGFPCCLHHLDPGLGGQGACFPQHFHLSTSSASALSSEKALSLACFPRRPPTAPLSTSATWTFDCLWQRSKCVCPKYSTLWNKIFWRHIYFWIRMFIISSLNMSWNLGNGKTNTWQ